jgi:dolichyl-phosphate-mannose--protein O-mannosyl transferase
MSEEQLEKFKNNCKLAKIQPGDYVEWPGHYTEVYVKEIIKEKDEWWVILDTEAQEKVSVEELVFLDH